jgi:hypothetical protein
LKKQRFQDLLRNEAAIIIQRNFASKYRSHFKLARATISSLKSFKRLYIVSLDLVIETVFNEYFNITYNDYIPQFLTVFEPAIEISEDQVITEYVESYWEKICGQYINEQILLLNTEQMRIAEERAQLEEIMMMSQAEEEMNQFLQMEEEYQKLQILQQLQKVENTAENVVDQITQSYLEMVLNQCVAMFAAQRYQEELLRRYEQEQQRKLFYQMIFQEFVTETTDQILSLAYHNAYRKITRNAEVDIIIAELAQKLTADTIFAAISICSDTFSYVKEPIDGSHVAMNDGLPVDSLVTEVAPEEEEEEMAAAVTEEAEATHISSVNAIDRIGTVNRVKEGAEYLTRGQYQQAIKEVNRVIEAVQKKMMEVLNQHAAATTAKNDHHDRHLHNQEMKFKILISISSLIKARALYALGEYSEAKKLLDQVRQDREIVLGFQHYLVAEVYLYLSEYYRAVGQYQDAENFIKQVSRNIILNLFEHCDDLQ